MPEQEPKKPLSQEDVVHLDQREQTVSYGFTNVSIVDLPMNNRRFRKCLDVFDMVSFGATGRYFRIPSLPLYDEIPVSHNYYMNNKKIAFLEECAKIIMEDIEKHQIEFNDDGNDECISRIPEIPKHRFTVGFLEDMKKVEKEFNKKIRKYDRELWEDVKEAERTIAEYRKTLEKKGEKRRPRATRKPYKTSDNKAHVESMEMSRVYLKSLIDRFRLEIWEDYPKGTRSGRPENDVKDKLFCIIDRIGRGLPAREYSGEPEKTAFEQGFIGSCPAYNTLLDFMNDPKVTPILHDLVQLSGAPMGCYEQVAAVDSSGFRTTNYGDWIRIHHKKAPKQETAGKKNIWKKLHIMMGIRTGVVMAMTVTNNEGVNIADVTQFKQLITDCRKYFDVKEVLADKGYIGNESYQLAQDYKFSLYIPFKTNSTDRGNLAWRRAYYFAKGYPNDFYEHYKLRNNVEAEFGAIKKRIGETILSVNPTAQRNELYCKVIAYNIWCVQKFDTEMQQTSSYLDCIPE